MSSVHNIDVLLKENDFGDILRELYNDNEFSSPNSEIRKTDNGIKFIDCINEIDIAFIPYHVITQFVYDPEEREVNQFAENLYISIKNDTEANEELKNKVLKIRLHILLAEQQKQSLYSEQNEQIQSINTSLSTAKINIQKFDKKLKKSDGKIKKAENVYNNIMSQYISILGIFAAILMTAFGGIQGFTAIYNNNFSLEDSLLIACVGFLGVILMMFMLLNSVSKLSGKSIDSSKSEVWYERHPTLMNSFIILTSMILFILAYKISMNPPSYSWWGFIYIIPLIYASSMMKIFSNFSLKKTYQKKD